MSIVRNVRRYFRLDVLVPAVIKLADKDEVVRVVLPELAGGAWTESEMRFDIDSRRVIEKLAQENETAGKILRDLQSRLDMLAEAIIWLVQGDFPQERIENYVPRRAMAALVMHLKAGSFTVDMLRALNEKIEFYFSVVDVAANKNYAAFLDMMKSVEFVFDSLLVGLAEKSSSGAVLAKAVLSLHAKLERHVDFLHKFRQEAQYMVNKDSWPVRKLNVSAGGVGFLSAHPYPKFARLVINFRLGPKLETFNMTGNIVSSRTLSDGEHYIAVEFTNAIESVQSRMIILLQNEELNQVMSYLHKPAKAAVVDDDEW
jgi:hypothetical protein